SVYSIYDGHGGYITGAAPAAPAAIPPAVFPTSSPPEPESSGYSTSMFDAHLLTAQFAHQGKNFCDSGFKSDGFGLSESDLWVADSGATYHVTGDPTFMFECKPPPVGKGTLLVGDMRSMRVECFGKLSMVMHSAGGDLDVVLMNVAYVPGFKFHLFSLHEVMPKCSAT
ncbi:unnamed protein product, partial [Laminaria digitata]